MTKIKPTPHSISELSAGQTVNPLQLNIQPIEKKQITDGSYLEVVSIFYTIQGEGPFTGHPAVFVRLAGCNLQCPACDTDYTSSRSYMPIEQILERITKEAPGRKPLIVVTGGEPFRQNIAPLCRMLIDWGFTVQIESNGTLAPSRDLPCEVVVVCSPKAGRINPLLLARANCFKYVLDHRSLSEQDGLPIKALDHSVREQVARPPHRDDRPVYLQPMDTKDDALNALNVQAVLNSCLKYGYILQLQIHKIIEVE